MVQEVDDRGGHGARVAGIRAQHEFGIRRNLVGVVSTPVNPVISPALAFAYIPFGSRASHISIGVSTKTSTKDSPAASCAARARSRSAR
jgi:hypothetical protein